MKSNNEFRAKGYDRVTEDTTKKAVKLPPIKKSGKERHALYGSLNDEDEDPVAGYSKRESVLDYFDDEEHIDEQFDDEQEWDEEYDDEDDDWD
jgi:hypothetical protein